ncbi:MAG: carbohydrate ABC transporter permease [Caldilineae bacterium]|nr:MAG: carbohydrate ABC transporter permease [Caldilineae bacterium]
MASVTATERYPTGRRIKWWNVFLYAILSLGGIAMVIPMYWTIAASFMTRAEAIATRWVPSQLHYENYINAWQEAQFSEYFINSVIITTITVTGIVVFSSLAAYAFARMEFTGKNFLFSLLLATIFIPEMVLLLPNFLTVTWLGRIGPLQWVDNWPALTIPFMGNVFSIFLLRQFFAQIPSDLFDAAKIDGASHLRFLTSVVLPLSKAPLMTIIIFSFIGSWNALAWPLLVTNSVDWRPIAVGLSVFLDEEQQRVHLQMAGAVITMLPVLLIYFFTQKQFTEGIALSGLKG